MRIRDGVAVVVGGLLAFVWSTISWMLIRWHQPSMNVVMQKIVAVRPAVADENP